MWSPCTHHILSNSLHLAIKHTTAGLLKLCHILLYGIFFISSYWPLITTTTLSTTLCLPTAVQQQERKLSLAWVMVGENDICGPCPALCGLYCQNVIVLRYVDNHNRRRARERQSSRERGGGSIERQLLLETSVRSLCAWQGGWEKGFC